MICYSYFASSADRWPSGDEVSGRIAITCEIRILHKNTGAGGSVDFLSGSRNLVRPPIDYCLAANETIPNTSLGSVYRCHFSQIICDRLRASRS